MAGECGEFEVDLSVLEHGGRPVAFLLGFLAHGVYHAFETGFDPQWAEQSPGLVLHFLALERLHDERLREFDFGHAHGYKARFDPALRETSEIRAFRSMVLSRIDHAFALAEAWLAQSAVRRRAPSPAPETN
jgi:CelD/BcsL family acetyltransferase involved in cellulose biosynthesis